MPTNRSFRWHGNHTLFTTRGQDDFLFFCLASPRSMTVINIRLRPKSARGRGRPVVGDCRPFLMRQDRGVCDGQCTVGSASVSTSPLASSSGSTPRIRATVGAMSTACTGRVTSFASTPGTTKINGMCVS